MIEASAFLQNVSTCQEVLEWSPPEVTNLPLVFGTTSGPSVNVLCNHTHAELYTVQVGCRLADHVNLSATPNSQTYYSLSCATSYYSQVPSQRRATHPTTHSLFLVLVQQVSPVGRPATDRSPCRRPHLLPHSLHLQDVLCDGHRCGNCGRAKLRRSSCERDSSDLQAGSVARSGC